MIINGRNRGSGIIEVIIGLTIVSVGIFALIRTYNYYIKFALAHRYDVQATLLAEEGIEAVKLMRDISWTNRIANLNSDINYGIALTDGVWTSTAGVNYVDNKFERSFVLSDVYRDPEDSIAVSGTLDPDTKKVTVTVSVRTILSTTTKSISTYITNIFDN